MRRRVASRPPMKSAKKSVSATTNPTKEVTMALSENARMPPSLREHQERNETSNDHSFGDLVAVALQLRTDRGHHIVVDQGQPVVANLPGLGYPGGGAQALR
eukprot:Skav203753  [mRNA]  locus=scaffold68:582773:585143:- [translate_table: standard]